MCVCECVYLMCVCVWGGGGGQGSDSGLGFRKFRGSLSPDFTLTSSQWHSAALIDALAHIREKTKPYRIQAKVNTTTLDSSL